MRVSTKEAAVNCVPMCRDVGVTTTPPASAASTSVSTMTERPAGAGDSVPADVRCGTPAYTQTDVVVVVEPAAAAVVASAVETAEVGTQSARPATVRTYSVGVTAKPRTYDTCVTARPALKHVGCSADVTDVSKPVPVPVTRATQTDAGPKPVSRSTQTAAAVDKDRPPPDVFVDRRHGPTARTDGVHENETTVRPVRSATVGRRSNSFHHYTAVQKEPTSPVSTSKIPRPKHPVTPEVNRKVLIRQDTYTKTPAEVCDDQTPPCQSPPQPLQPVADDDRDKVDDK